MTILSNVKFSVEDFFKFCGLLRISELYWPLVDTWIWHGYPGVPFEKSSFSDLNHQKHFNIIMFHFISQRFAPSVEPLVFGYGSKETLHIQSSTWPRGVCQLGHGHRGCLLQMCSRLHHSPQVQQWSQSQRGNWLLKVTTYLLSLLTISGLAVVLFEKLIIKFVHFSQYSAKG